MKVYGINLIIVYIFTSLSNIYSRKEKTNLVGGPKPNIYFLLIAIFSMILVSGLRYGVGTDFFNYENIFIIQSQETFSSVLFKKEGLFWIVSRLVMGITNNLMYVNMMYSIIIIYLIVKTISNYSTQIELSVALYILTMSYYSSFNGVRQWVAAAILFYASRYIYSNNFWKYIAIVTFASGFHISAIIMIPLFFIIRKKPWSKIIVLIVTATIVASIFFPQFINLLSNLLEGNEYQKYTILDKNDNGVNILRVIVALVPVLLSFIYYKRINPHRKIEIDVWINMSLINFLILFLSMRITVLARFVFYFELYNVLLIPLLLRIFNKRSKKIFYYIILILYLFYMLALLPRESNLLPYSFFQFDK